MLLDVILCLVKYLQFFEIRESLRMTTELVVDLELSSNIRKVLE